MMLLSVGGMGKNLLVVHLGSLIFLRLANLA